MVRSKSTVTTQLRFAAHPFASVRGHFAFLNMLHDILSFDDLQSSFFDIILGRHRWLDLAQEFSQSPEIVLVELVEENVRRSQYRVVLRVVST